MTDPDGGLAGATSHRATASVVAAVERAPIVVGTTRAEFLAHMTNEEQPWSAHLTAIAWVFDPRAHHVLLVAHRVLGWSCPGGHLDDGEDPSAAARRELREETGIDARPRSRVPLTISTSLGCARWPDARHWTFGFAFEVRLAAELRAEPGQNAAWFPIVDLPEPRAPDIDVVLEHVRRAGLPRALR